MRKSNLDFNHQSLREDEIESFFVKNITKRLNYVYFQPTCFEIKTSKIGGK